MATKAKTKTIPIDHYFRLLETEVGRARLAAASGISFGGRRDLYTSLGYNRLPTFDDFLDRYRRNEIARSVVTTPVSESWKLKPTVSVANDKSEKFKKAWEAIVKSTGMWSKLSRLDRLAGIGEYAVLVLGFDDKADLKEELVKGSAKTLLYATPYSQGTAVVNQTETNTKNARYGLPTVYQIKPKGKTSELVHWTRAIHVTEDPLEDEVYGEPRMKVVLNRIDNLELVCGGSSEMYWRGALPGTIFKLPAEANLNPDDAKTQAKIEDIKTKIEAFVHDLQRDLLVAGIEAQQLQVQIADPSANIESLLSLVSAGSRIPKRILMGSERGELASSQDEENWLSMIDTRNQDFCEVVILRPTIDRLIYAGVLDEPAGGYTLDWPDHRTKSDKEVADTAVATSTALRNYVESLGADIFFPWEAFFEDVLHLSPSTMDKIRAQMGDVLTRTAPVKGTDDDAGGDTGLDGNEPGDEPAE